MRFFQVFDVVINGDVTAAADLDIYDRVGRGTAHDEYIEFEAKDGRLIFGGAETDLTRGKMRVEFIKVSDDWPEQNMAHPFILVLTQTLKSSNVGIGQETI